jgi:hypothetical protein
MGAPSHRRPGDPVADGVLARDNVAEVNASTSAGDSTRGSLRVARTSGTPDENATSPAESATRAAPVCRLLTTACRNEKTPDTIDNRAPSARHWGRYAPAPIMEITASMVICEVSDFMQDEIVEELQTGWPMRPDHGVGA